MRTTASQKKWIWFCLLALLLSIAPATPAAAAPTSGVIDLSHENPTTWGFTLGTKDEVKRWQTFTAPYDLDLQRAGVYLVEKQGDGSLTDLVAELYETQNGVPNGEPLKTVTVQAADVKFGTETFIDFAYPGLTSGKQYAIALTQTALSENGLMHNYSWPAKEVSAKEHFGKFSGGSWVDESFLGEGWLKIYYQYEPSPAIAASIHVSDKYVNLRVNESISVTASVYDQYDAVIPDAPLNWSSDNPAAAVVDGGNITAAGEGSAVVTVSSGQASAQIQVTVSNLDGVIPVPGMIITENTKFKPGTYDFSNGQGIIIGADNLSIEGNGAVLIGPGHLPAGPNSFAGTGISSDGHSGVSLKNVNVKGFNVGLHIVDGRDWTVEGNDFSDNYSNPDYGWGDGPAYGAVYLENVHHSTIAGNKGNRVWNGLHFRYSNDNVVKNNDFSHTSNVSLKMWNASSNEISDNNFSYGIRIAPGEVHARDSTSMLMESGSNGNKLLRNDFTHGGDGIFIRVLNGWVSTGNYFEGNDASYANNNAVESWSPGNTYVRNIANYSSYGFWLGGSDHTTLIGNEVKYNGGYNGQTPRNAPEAFGNAGIAVVNGASSHFKLIQNTIEYNNGPGVAIRYNPDYPAFHWVIQQNTIKHNQNDPRGYKGYGIYMKNARWIDLAGNDITDNGDVPVYKDTNVADVFDRSASMSDQAPIAAVLVSANTVAAGQAVTFDASGSSDPQGQPLYYRWDMGDDTIEGGPVVTHTYDKPGFYRVGVTVNNGKLADLAYYDLYVTGTGAETGTDAAAAEWSLTSDDPAAVIAGDSANVVQGAASIHVSARSGTNHTLQYPASKQSNLNLADSNTLSFWLKYEAEYGGDQGNRRPVVRLHSDDQNYYEYSPSAAYLDQLFAPISEQRYEWKPIRFNFKSGDGSWSMHTVGSPSFDQITYVTIQEGPSTGGISDFWIDALQFTSELPALDLSVDVAANPTRNGLPMPISSSSSESGSFSAWAPLLGKHAFNGAATPRWTPDAAAGPQLEDWYGVDFGIEREVNRADVYVYHNPTGTPAEDTEWKPDRLTIQYWNGKKWKDVRHPAAIPAVPQGNLNRISFDLIQTSKLRVLLVNHKGNPVPASSSLYAFGVYNTQNAAANRTGMNEPAVSITSSVNQQAALQKVGVYLNRLGTDQSDLVAELYETSSNAPTGAALQTVTIPVGSVNFGQETQIPFDYNGLVAGKQYAVSLTQKNPPPNGSNNIYRWPTRNLGNQEHFGKFVGTSWIDESFLGSGWMKVYTGQGIIDFSFANPGSGYGVGHADDETKRWQTFTVPADKIWQVIDGSVQPDNGWKVTTSQSAWTEISFQSPQTFNKMNVYFAASAAEAVELPKAISVEYWNGARYVPVKLKGKWKPVANDFTALSFPTVTASKVRLVITPQNGSAIELKEWEIRNSSSDDDNREHEFDNEDED